MRFTAGEIELALKVNMSDKTNWKKMLNGDLVRNQRTIFNL